MAPTTSSGPTTTATARASGAASLDPSAGKERTDERGVAQVWVPAGTFLMGTDETDPTGDLAPPDWARFELASERPQHEVSHTLMSAQRVGDAGAPKLDGTAHDQQEER